MKVVILIAVLLALGVWVLWRRRSNAASPTEPTADEERSLAEQLSTGEAGLKWEVPSTWDFVSSNGNVAEWIDREQGLHWHLAIAFFGLDASEQHLDLLRQDIERQAQDEFEPNTPRTRQQGWSPVISVKLVRVDGVGAVEIVRRLTYQPGNEIVEGQVMIPLAGGTALITVTSRAAITGLREVLLSMAEMEKRDPETDGWPELTQEQIDDPSLDEFDEEGMSPIAAVRRAVGWLVAADGACLRVTQPSEVFSSDVVALPDAKCSIIPPPRYVKVPERFPRGDSQNVLSRVGLGATGARLIDVYRLVDQVFEPDDQESLKEVAVASARDWASEGVTDISCEVSPIAMNDGRYHVGNHIQLRAQGIPSQTFAHWFIDHDGVAFRVSACGALHVPLAELVADTRQCVETFQRL